MDDRTIADRIEALVAEEHALQSKESDEAAHGVSTDDARTRLDAVSVELDRCWDLLRQRRALRDAGADPDDAEARDATTVERYWQ
jgi:Protein of unknown function (DUF2630)